MYRVEPLFTRRVEHGEGPVWDPEAGTLYWVDLLQGKFYRASPLTGAVSEFAVSQPLGHAQREDQHRDHEHSAADAEEPGEVARGEAEQSPLQQDHAPRALRGCGAQRGRHPGATSSAATSSAAHASRGA